MVIKPDRSDLLHRNFTQENNCTYDSICTYAVIAPDLMGWQIMECAYRAKTDIHFPLSEKLSAE